MNCALRAPDKTYLIHLLEDTYIIFKVSINVIIFYCSILIITFVSLCYVKVRKVTNLIFPESLSPCFLCYNNYYNTYK